MQEPLLNQARTALRQGQLARAESLANAVLEQHRTSGEAACILGQVAMHRSQFDLAAIWLQRAVAADRRQAPYWVLLANAHLVRGKLREALAASEKALKLQPDHDEALAGKADALERSGKAARAVSLLASRVRRTPVPPRVAAVYARALQTQKQDDDVIAFLDTQLARTALPPPARRSFLLMLGRSLDRVGDYDRAFAACAEGNAVNASAFDVAAIRERFDAIMDAFSPEATVAYAQSGIESEIPVFVFGMPRSGTTLIEQIIHAHPDACGAGEIHDLAHLRDQIIPRTLGGEPWPTCLRSATGAQLAAFGRSYLERLRACGKDALRVVDKSLENYECLGLIALLLPRARVIHARRNPLDVCLSCFFQDLSPQLHPYAGDLGDLGRLYREYARLMDFWRETGPIEMLEVDYETLVADQAAESRRIIDFIGLPWDDRCLRFHEAKRDVATISYDQVRQPIYTTAVARHRKYERHLSPLRDALGDRLDEPAGSARP